ncbi:MAG: hypothetical protein HKO55_02345 [Gammaproteobacteria bacterium]|nr:hypothetical protein [Gammaproteobacteria bacterium]
MHSHIRTGLAGLIASLLLAGAATAQLAPYSQDFEGLDINGANIGDGWRFFINVYEDDGSYLFGYPNVATPAPNGPQISALTSGEGGAEQGAQQLSVFSDYNCCAGPPPSGHQESLGDTVETNVFQEQTIAAGDVGSTWTFGFEYKTGNLGGATTALAFIKVLDPASNFSLTTQISVDVTTPTAEWSGDEVVIIIGDWAGQILQFGFQSNASDFEPSGVFYDNVSFSGDSGPTGFGPFADNFELYDAAATMPTDKPLNTGIPGGWLVFGNVSAQESFLYGFGPFPAPNDGDAFSQITTGEGGADQGAQQLNTFSAYNNGDAHPIGDPTAACDVAGFNVCQVESVIYQQFNIGTDNLGQTWFFRFDAKLPDSEFALAPPSEGEAFIKVLDPTDNLFTLTAEASVDTSSTPTDWQGYGISLTIDPLWVGQVIQIGFANTAANGNPSGIFYDNVNFAPDVDTDNDTVFDGNDNCTLAANPSQLDTDGDNIGNACDGDIDNNCTVEPADLAFYRVNFLQSGDLATDNNGDGVTDVLDLAILRTLFLLPAGPSGLPNACSAR